MCQLRIQGEQVDISLLLGLGASPRPSNKDNMSVDAQLTNVSVTLVELFLERLDFEMFAIIRVLF